MKKSIWLAVMWMVCIMANLAQAEIVGQEINYESGGVALKGYLTYDDAIAVSRPGILVVHEWWGYNAYARKRARMLAELGYTALAVDMYGGGKQAAHPEDAEKFSSAVMQNLPVAKERFLAAMKVLQQHPTVNAGQIAAIGYCFGGGVVLNMARLGVDLKGVASFHGSLGTGHSAQPGQVKARVLVCNGADDQFVKPEQIARFKQEMKDARVSYQFLSYKGAQHSFTNPDADTFGQRFNLPLAYNAEADRRSWADMQKFFRQIFLQK